METHPDITGPELDCLIETNEATQSLHMKGLSHLVQIWGPKFLSEEIEKARISLQHARECETLKEVENGRAELIGLMTREMHMQLGRVIPYAKRIRRTLTEEQLDEQRFHFNEWFARYMLCGGLHKLPEKLHEDVTFQDVLGVLEGQILSRGMNMEGLRLFSARNYRVRDPYPCDDVVTTVLGEIRKLTKRTGRIPASEY